MRNNYSWLLVGTKEFSLMMVLFSVIVFVLVGASYVAKLAGLHPTFGMIAVMLFTLYGMALRSSYLEEQKKQE